MRKSLQSTVVATALWLGLARAADAFVFVDPVNLVQNFISATESVLQTAQQVQQTVAQYRQLAAQIANARGLDAYGLLSGMDPEQARQYQMLTRAQSDLDALQSQLQGGQQRFEARVAAASNAGLTTAQYEQKLVQSAQAGDAQAAKIVEQDRSTLDGVNATIQETKAWRGQIGGLNDNIGGSMQLLNTQLNALVQTNAQMLRYMAEQSSTRASARGGDWEKAAEAKALADTDQQSRDRIGKSEAAAAQLAGQTWADPFATKK